jgi:chromosome segregation ATPase
MTEPPVKSANLAKRFCSTNAAAEQEPAPVLEGLLEQLPGELPIRAAEYGAALPEPSESQELLTQLRVCSEAAQQQVERAHEQLRCVSALCDELRERREKCDRLDSAALAARDRLAELEREIAEKSTLTDGELEAARLRIQHLTDDLHWARNANERLRSLLSVFGVVDHLESPHGTGLKS